MNEINDSFTLQGIRGRGIPFTINDYSTRICGWMVRFTYLLQVEVAAELFSFILFIYCYFVELFADYLHSLMIRFDHNKLMLSSQWFQNRNFLFI